MTKADAIFDESTALIVIDMLDEAPAESESDPPRGGGDATGGARRVDA